MRCKYWVCNMHDMPPNAVELQQNMNMQKYPTVRSVRNKTLISHWGMQDCIDAGQLSNAQIEAVVYAFMRFNRRLQNGKLLQTYLAQTCMP